MKIKNLAFFGIMAAIMGVAGTARADTTTVIASQAYVDAKDALDEKTANKETATYADSTNKGSTTVYPSMKTLADAYTTLDNKIDNMDLSDTLDGLDLTAVSESGKPIVSVSQANGQVAASVGTITTAGIATDAIATSISATNSTSNEKLATETAVRGAIDELDNATATGSGTVVKNVTQTNGVITAEMGTIADADVASDAAIADTKISFSEPHTTVFNSGITSEKVSGYDTTKTTVDNATDDNVVATSTANANLLKGTGLQSAVAHLKGNGAGKYTAGVDNTDTANTGIKNETVSTAAKTAWDKTLETQKGDDYLTTLAAVERRVQEGVKEAVSQSGNYVSQTITNGTTATAPSEDAVYNALATKQNTLTFDDAPTAGSTNPVTSGGVQTALDGKVAKNDNITASSSNSIVTYDEKGLVTGGTAAGALATKNTIANTDVASDAAIVSTKLNVGTGYDSSTATGDVATSDSVQTALAKIEHKANNAGTSAINSLNVNDTADGRPVTEVDQTNGAIAVTRGTITYKDGLNYQLSNINATGGDGSKACVKGSPCTLTMFLDNNEKPVYEWTNMDTESTDAVI